MAGPRLPNRLLRKPKTIVRAPMSLSGYSGKLLLTGPSLFRLKFTGFWNASASMLRRWRVRT